MRLLTRTARSVTVLATMAVLVACSGDDGAELASIGLDEGGDPRDATSGSLDDVQEGDGSEEDPTASQDLDVVDLTEAVPGTWPVGDAGMVTFSIVDGALVLDDVTANDGWMVAIDEQDADEIEIDFTRGNVQWQIEIELKDGGRILEIEIDQDIEPADPGSYSLGDAGTFAFSVVEGRLVLDDLNIADGWTLVELDEESDEIEFELVNGPRSIDVEVELEDEGTIELEIDYTVVGPVTP